MTAESREFTLAGRQIGPDHPPYIIAELSGNHNGDLKRAVKLIEAAAAAGVDAVKLQTYTADTITIDHDGPGFVIDGGPWHGRSLYDLYQEAHTPWDWHEELFACGRRLGVTVFSSPFDETAVDFLETLGCPAYKIASFEAMDQALVRKAASTGKPLIISTGMVAADEATDALTWAREGGAQGVALLHCVSAYPAPTDASNLKAIPAMMERYDTVIGLSDHSPGTTVASTAVGLGAAIVEKHVCLARADGGVDSTFSLEPAELALLVTECRTAWAALGTAHIGRQPAAETNAVFRRSLYVVADVRQGEVFTASNVRSIRPGFGLAPALLGRVMGRRATRHLKRGEPLSLSDIDGAEDLLF